MSSTPAEQQYDVWARWYDRIWHRYSERTARLLVERAPVSPEDRVLDVGCGTGAVERQLLRRHSRQYVTGVDVSEKMLAKARKKADGPNVAYVQAAASEMPFDDDTFDVVLSASAFHYFPKPRAAAAEFKRVLRASGRLYVLDWCRDSRLMKLRDVILRRIDPAHVRCYTAAEVRDIFASEGFTACRTDTFRSGTYRMLLFSATLR